MKDSGCRPVKERLRGKGDLLSQLKHQPGAQAEAFTETAVLRAIADYLGCSIDYLVGRTENPDVNR